MLRDGISMFRNDLTAEYLREILHYEPDTGLFRWKTRTTRKDLEGKVAGSKVTDDYHGITIDGVKYAAHRLAWLYVHGQYPKDQLDHANGIRNDNRISNLRESTQSENMQNARHKRSGQFALGTTYRKNVKKWAASIKINGDKKNLGCFDTQEEAHQVYVAAKLKYHTFNPTICKPQ